jgi:DNA-binding NtrC family response regulator
MRDFLVDVLEEAGYDAVSAADGTKAIDRVSNDREHIDAVITDVRMPGAPGTELLAAVMRSRAEAPVIIITAFGSVEQAVEMVMAGA